MDQDDFVAVVGCSHCNDQEDGVIEYDDGGADQDFDAEVARFLEIGFFGNDKDGGDINSGAVARLSTQPCANKPSVLSQNEDAVLMDFIETFDIPGLKSDVVGDSHMNNLLSEADAESANKPQVVVAAEDLQPTSSLYVLIPASALSPPSSLRATRLQQKPVQKTSLPVVKARRKRVKDEIEYLRQQVEDFEEKLEKLQQAFTGEKVALYTDALSSRQGQFASQAAYWKRTAKRQELETKKSQAENIKLREELSKQLVLARSLSKLLEKRQNVSVSTHDISLSNQVTHLRESYADTCTFLCLSSSCSRLHQLDARRRRNSVSCQPATTASLRCSQPTSSRCTASVTQCSVTLSVLGLRLA